MKMERKLLVASFVVVLVTFITETQTSSANDKDTINIIASFIKQRHSVSAIFFVKFKRDDMLQLVVDLSVHNVETVVHVPTSRTNLTSMLKTSFHPIVVVVDMKYQENILILKQASKKKLFSRLHHWMLLCSNVKETVAVLENLFIPLSSHVMLINRDNTTNQSMIQDVYHMGKDEPLTITLPQFWNPEHFPLEARRVNYGGIYIPTVVVLAQGTWKDFTDFRYRHINTESKVQYTLMKLIAKMLNFRIKECLTHIWGYPINGSHCFNGAVGLLQCGNCEIGATGLMFKTERMPLIDYAGETLTFRGAFMFLKPSLSAVSVIYELPFSTSIWITYFVVVAILALVLMLTRKIHHQMSRSSARPITWGEILMDILAIVCQQDALHVPKNISSRIVFIFMLVLSLFLTTSYSATIVSLLQTSSDAIRTLQDLMTSSLKLSMIDIFVNETTDSEISRIFKEKLYIQPFQEAFTTEDIGIEKIRHGLYAYHGLSGSYKIMSDIFEEDEKCRYQEINMFTSLHLCFTARKGSPYIQHLKERTCWLREVGLVDREDKKWFYQKPKCESAGQNFVSVGIQDFYPALVVLAYGILGSIGVLIAEMLYKQKQRLNCFKTFPNVVQRF